MNEIQLRDYQQECVDIINNTESGSYLVAVATGLGKTVIFSHIARRGRMLILSHREELVWQPKKYFDCSYGVEKADIHSNGEEVVSASVQSLVRRLESFSPDDFDIITPMKLITLLLPHTKRYMSISSRGCISDLPQHQIVPTMLSWARYTAA